MSVKEQQSPEAELAAQMKSEKNVNRIRGVNEDNEVEFQVYEWETLTRAWVSDSNRESECRPRWGMTFQGAGARTGIDLEVALGLQKDEVYTISQGSGLWSVGQWAPSF